MIDRGGTARDGRATVNTNGDTTVVVDMSAIG